MVWFFSVAVEHLRHGCFPAKRKERFFYTRWLEIEKKPKSFVGPCPLWTGDTLSVLVLRHVSDSDSFRYQAFVLVSVTNPSVVVLGKCNESLCLFVRISEIANKRLMVKMHCQLISHMPHIFVEHKLYCI